MAQLEVKGISFNYEEIGTGRVLLCLHGRPLDHCSMMYDLEPVFQQRDGWRRIYPDLPGMGKTPGASWTTSQDHVLDVVTAFIDSLVQGECFAVAGTSYGGFLARGIVHRRSRQMNGVLMTVPAAERDPTRQNFPQHRTIVRDPDCESMLTPDE